MAIVNNAHVSFSGERSALGVIGTLGTSDVGGTALTLAIAVDGTTGAQWQREIGTPNVILSGGTLQSGTIGSIQNIGTLPNLNIATGTINVGTFNNTGTFVNLSTGTLNVGTVAVSNTPNIGTITTLPGIPSGTINVGTVTANVVTGSLVGTILGGTLQNLNYGTINIDPTPIPVRTLITTYGTTGTTGAAVFGTLVAAVGAGTKAYISGYQIIGISGTAESSIIIGTFTQATPAGGTNMITRTNAVPGGGVARDRAVPFVSGTNGTICYWMSGAGSVYFQVDYWAAT